MPPLPADTSGLTNAGYPTSASSLARSPGRSRNATNGAVGTPRSRSRVLSATLYVVMS